MNTNFCELCRSTLDSKKYASVCNHEHFLLSNKKCSCVTVCS